ncbi:CHAT domain-containing protein [Boletus edulis BED1]|uniref:CHAT domain-containing protein n=1 Tax=Boletus edulis BED1 TaxID=1328754 RepID=A0AAD4C098_BOLED|nr:CHAT domain-containing protein [Boletus edulis BED1]
MSTWTKFGLMWKRVWTSRCSTSINGEERPQHEPSTSMWTRFGLPWKRAWTLMRSGSSTGGERPQPESSTPPCSSTLTDGIQTSNSCPQYAGQEPENGEKSGSEDQPQDGPSSSGSAQEQGIEKESGHEDDPQDEPSFPGPVQEQGEEGNPSPGDQPQGGSSSSSSSVTHMGKDEEIVIMDIQVKEPALGLLRLPAGFYTVVHHSGLEWRTENKRSSASDDVVEWSGPIPLPSDLSATVCLEVYASFEFQPMLGTGEHLRKLTITVDKLLDRSAKHVPFILFPKNGDIVSPCSSILVTVKQRSGERSDSSASRILGPLCSTTNAPNALGDASNHGHSALSRYRKHGDRRDLERSIAEFEQALNTCLPNHPCRAAAQSNLATAKSIFCWVDDTNASFEIPLGLYRDALAARPVGHADRPSTLIQLAAVYLARFEKQGVEFDGARVEALLHEAMELSSSDSHEKRAVSFMLQLYGGHRVGPASGQSSMDSHPSLRLTDEDPWRSSVSLLKRFERYGDLADLERAIGLLQKLVRSVSVWEDGYRASLGNLGVALLWRFEHVGELSDLEDCISTFKDANDLTPDGHPNKPSRLDNLGHSFITRFERLGELRDLEHGISTLRDANDLTPHGHPDKSSRLNNLGHSFRVRFKRLGELSDLEHAILTLREAVYLTPHENPRKPCRLNNLGNSFSDHFERLGELSDLEHAISTHRKSVDLTPDSHPHKPSHLDSLGNSLKARFERLGELSDLEHAISTHREAVDLTPHCHPDKPNHLNNLGNSFRARFECLGELSDLEHAISTHREAVDLTPHGHPDKPGRMNNLGMSFITRFERLGELRDLEHAVLTLREAVDLTPHGHPYKPSYLSNLGMSSIIRFERLGELSDLEHSISTLKEAVDLTPPGHPDKPGRLNNLGHSFIARFERLGELSDLEHGNSTLGEAVDLTPDGHPDKPGRLNNLGNSFRTRFERLGELMDLEHSISTHKEAVDLTPHGHPGRPSGLNNLGISFRARFERLGELSDLEHAISTLREAIDLTPHGHPDKPSGLNNLGIFFITRFERVGELSDLEHAILTCREAVDLTPHGHPDKPGRLNCLGNSFRARFERLGEPKDLEDAISLYLHSASVPIGPVSVRFRASRNWISCARRIHHPSLLRAYSIAINLFPQLAWIGLSLTHRYAELKRGADVVREAAAAALDEGFPELAVEWLEQGHSIVWGELLQLRGSYEQLSSAHPDHACRLRELSTALDDAGATREKSLSIFLESTDDPMQRAIQTLEQEVNRHRTLAIERDKLLQEIRRLPGFERFLLPKHFPQLRASAHSGPIVMLNAAETRCDVLILLADVDHVIHVPLPNFNLQRSVGLQNMLGKLLGDARATPFDDRTGRVATRGAGSWETLLSTLFNGVIKPVLDALAFSTVGDLSRIFWCPTGPFVFLPIHAAGLYGTQYSSPGHKVSDFVISSYTPTLSILAQPNCHMAHSNDFRLLLVGQPSSDGQAPLRGVAPELRHIRTVVENPTSACTTLVESSAGTVEEVLGLMKDADWVHFACHGVQDPGKPTDSGLCLADKRRLKISDIIGLSRSRGGLAFLSACQTAMGDEGLTDEAIHIAAGMLFAGYGGVIGTMWSISDKLAPVVARRVYEYLFRNGTRPDHRDAARALHEAVGRLRESGEASFTTWVPFIHVGL